MLAGRIERLVADVSRLLDDAQAGINDKMARVVKHIINIHVIQPDRIVKNRVRFLSPFAFHPNRLLGMAQRVSQPAASYAQYVIIISAPARVIDVNVSRITRSRSIQPF